MSRLDTPIDVADAILKICDLAQLNWPRGTDIHIETGEKVPANDSLYVSVYELRKIIEAGRAALAEEKR